MATIEINQILIPPGNKTTVLLPMPKLYDWTPLKLPVHVVNGISDGPVLCLTSTLHGDEVNGIEIIRRFLKKLSVKKLAGTVIAAPIINIYGFLNQSRYLMDRRDLNRSFPGSQTGSLASRLAHLVTKELLSKSTHCIDIHTGSMHRFNLPQIRTNVDQKENIRLAHAFKAPVVLHAKERDGSFRQIANDYQIPFLVYEAGEALRFDERSIRFGVTGIQNVMRELKMLSPLDKKFKTSRQVVARYSYWVRSPYSGILRHEKALGDKVQKGEVLCTIANPTDVDEHSLHSQHSGIIICRSNLPLVHEGAALYHIACFEKPGNAEHPVGDLQELEAEDLYIE